MCRFFFSKTSFLDPNLAAWKPNEDSTWENGIPRGGFLSATTRHHDPTRNGRHSQEEREEAGKEFPLFLCFFAV
jgi:hypothetical protein